MEKMIRMAFVAVMVISLSSLVAGCGKKKVQTDAGVAPVKSAMPAESLEDQGNRGISESGMGAGPESLDNAGKMEEELYPVLEGRTSGPMLPVYFDFDKSNIREDQTSRIEDNVEFMNNNKMVRVRIEGNCDERGTNEYNMALGQRRALSAQKYMVNLGINASRLETISYGEEKPLLFGHDEYSWAQNRRDDFVAMR
jgi:peptidoglycan-associated lipoprotein